MFRCLGWLIKVVIIPEKDLIKTTLYQGGTSPVDDDDDDDDDLDNLPTFPEAIDLPDDFKLEAEPFPPISTTGFPEPTLVPGKEGGKIKTFYKCEKCNKSFPKRKRYYNHKFNGKCTIEPKWIRWHKNHKRVECAHPDCGDKAHINYTYPGLMKHIIEMHTIQEDSVSWTKVHFTFFFGELRVYAAPN